MSVKDLVSREPGLKGLLKLVLENPYIERKDLAALAGIEAEAVDTILGPALSEMYVLELASQADSSVESRVPKTVYLVNPEMEEEVGVL
ncbi:MAG: hypothetical protein AB1576_09360 [Bacillota bacterium]|jgi:hypothetical protein